MCDLEVLVIIKDKEFKRITIYNSSDQSFHPAQVKELAKPIDHSIIDEPGRRNKKTTSYQYICNDDYHRFSHEKDNDRDQDDDQSEEEVENDDSEGNSPIDGDTTLPSEVQKKITKRQKKKKTSKQCTDKASGILGKRNAGREDINNNIENDDISGKRKNMANFMKKSANPHQFPNQRLDENASCNQ